jgi:hypothetical protein
LSERDRTANETCGGFESRKTDSKVSPRQSPTPPFDRAELLWTETLGIVWRLVGDRAGTENAIRPGHAAIRYSRIRPKTAPLRRTHSHCCKAGPTAVPVLRIDRIPGFRDRPMSSVSGYRLTRHVQHRTSRRGRPPAT